MRPSRNEETGDYGTYSDDENIPYQKLVKAVNFPRTYMGYENNTNEKIIYLFFSEKLNKYKRFWVIREQYPLDYEQTKYTKKCIEDKLNYVIQKLQSKKTVDRCLTIYDTVLCLINNDPTENIADFYRSLKITIPEINITDKESYHE